MPRQIRCVQSHRSCPVRGDGWAELPRPAGAQGTAFEQGCKGGSLLGSYGGFFPSRSQAVLLDAAGHRLLPQALTLQFRASCGRLEPQVWSGQSHSDMISWYWQLNNFLLLWGCTETYVLRWHWFLYTFFKLQLPWKQDSLSPPHCCCSPALPLIRSRSWLFSPLAFFPGGQGSHGSGIKRDWREMAEAAEPSPRCCGAPGRWSSARSFPIFIVLHNYSGSHLTCNTLQSTKEMSSRTNHIFISYVAHCSSVWCSAEWDSQCSA